LLGLAVRGGHLQVWQRRGARETEKSAV
jgi:hypothetical protein